MALLSTDLFLINRKDGSDWKSYKISYGDFKNDLLFEIHQSVDVYTYVDTTRVLEYQFGSQVEADIKYKDITVLRFPANLITTAVTVGDVILMKNATLDIDSTYSITSITNNVSSGGENFDEVEVTFRSTSATDAQFLVAGNQCTFTIGVYTSGGEVAVGDNPPTNPGEGDLWFNSNNGIMYVWYLNDGTTDGQWVDVRPR